MTANPFIGRPHDFDFLQGRWQVANRRLRQRHAGCDAWDEFHATQQGWVLLDGIVSIDEVHFPTQGFSGLTLRSLDLAATQWSIYWINSTNGRLFPPVRGGFDGERGEFYGEDSDAGRVVQVRFVWTRLGPDATRWEQAFALAGGAWETNWVMAFSRIDAAAAPTPSPSRSESSSKEPA